MHGRVNAVLAVTRALGDHRMKDVISGKPHTSETILTDENEIVVLACDGVWDVMTDQEVIETVRAIEDPQTASEVLVDRAIEKGSEDNISAIVIRIKNVK